MIKFNQKEQEIINILFKKGQIQSSEVHEELIKSGEDLALITVKRALSELVDKNALKIKGSGRSTTYTLTVLGRVFTDIDLKDYMSTEPDKRYGFDSYNFDLFKEFPKDIFSSEELDKLKKVTEAYQKRTEKTSDTIQKKELERLIIEFSWKSSKIEGNTYSLLDTEKLISENQPAEGKTEEETQMILNHKDAFNFIYNNQDLFTELNLKNIKKLHEILVQDLSINTGLREGLVGISGSAYRPLDNIYQIEEALESLSILVNGIDNPFTKSLVALLGTSYIQPFEDGNKRTSRLLANALLLAHDCAPLSYRSVDEEEYKSAMLVFYELNSVIPFKEIFIDQYIFSAENYNVRPNPGIMTPPASA